MITAAIHGDEYPGMAAAIRIAKEIDPQKVTGKVLLFPCVNTSGFWARTLFLPEDGANLNANYPGDPCGTVGERVAHYFVREIFPQVDFIVDLHSGSAMEPLCDCLFFPAGAGEVVEQAALSAARATGIPYLIASTAAAGHYSYAATALGIPGLLLERGHSGLCRESWVAAYCRDIRLLLAHLQVCAYTDAGSRCAQKVYRETIYLCAAQDGLWYPAIAEGATIKQGELLGHMEDFWGNPIAEYRAEGDGMVFYYTGSLSLKQKQLLVAYGLDEYAE